MQDGCETHLVLVDGSPAYVATHTARGKAKRAARSAATDEADALTYFAQLFADIDANKVTSRAIYCDSLALPCRVLAAEILERCDGRRRCSPSWRRWAGGRRACST